MDTNLEFLVFEGEGGAIDEKLLDNLTVEDSKLVKEMMVSSHYNDGIVIPRFLREDLTINLEKLELAVSLAVKALEANSSTDITLNLVGLQEYFFLRGILGDDEKERQERTFILGFVSAIASEASLRDTLVVKYVQN